MRLLRVIVFILCLTCFPSTIKAADCQFMLGFATLRDLIGHEIVGECLENQRYAANGNSEQHTTGGLLVWRKADNWTAFTDGYRSWIHGPNGLVQRLNTERFAWEAAPTPTPVPRPTTTPTLRTIDDELAVVLEVMTSTPSGKTLRAWFDEAVPSLTYGAAPEDWTGIYHDPPRNEIILDQSLRAESIEVQAALLAWEVGFAVNAKRHGPKSERWLSGTDCMKEVVAAEEAMVRWWVERFGTEGMQSATTDWEVYFNEQIEYYENGNLGIVTWLYEGYKEWCAPYGEIGGYIDPRLDRVFAMMRTTATGRKAYEWFQQSGASASFANVEGGGGQYQRSLNLVTLDQNLMSKPVSVSAALLVHEIYHVKHATGEAGEACMEEETVAHRFQAQWWQEYHGSEKSGVDDWHDGLLHLYQKGWIGEWVRDTEFYQEKCKIAAAQPSPTPTPVPTATPQPTPTPEPELAICWEALVARGWLEASLRRNGVGGEILQRLVQKHFIPAINTVEFACEALKSLGYRVTGQDIKRYLTNPEYRQHMLCLIDPHLDQRNRDLLHSIIRYTCSTAQLQPTAVPTV